MTQSIPTTEQYEFHAKKKSFALIIGVYNEGGKFTRQLTQLQPYREIVDIIIADGNSGDGATTPEALRDNVRALLINKDTQRGLSVQYRSALYYALSQEYDGVIMMDGNGKDGVDAIPLFIDKLNKGFDFVQGSRFLPGGHHENTPIDRVLGIRFVFNPIMNIACRYRYTDAMNGYKACSRAFLCHPRVQPFREVFVRYNLQYYFNYIAPRLKLRVSEVPVSRVYIKDPDELQSKIVGLEGRMKIMRELFNTILGRYNV